MYSRGKVKMQNITVDNLVFKDASGKTIEVLDKRVYIHRDHGPRQTVAKIPYSEIRGITFRKAGMITTGYMSIITDSFGMPLSNSNTIRFMSEVNNDPNTVIFPRKMNNQMRFLIARIRDRM